MLLGSSPARSRDPSFSVVIVAEKSLEDAPFRSLGEELRGLPSMDRVATRGGFRIQVSSSTVVSARVNMLTSYSICGVFTIALNVPSLISVS